MVFLNNYEAIMYVFVLFLKKSEFFKNLRNIPNKIAASWLYLNTSYLTDSNISFTLKLESLTGQLGQVHMTKKMFFLHEGRLLFLLLNL